jgi:hypothetical protein
MACAASLAMVQSLGCPYLEKVILSVRIKNPCSTLAARIFSLKPKV